MGGGGPRDTDEGLTVKQEIKAIDEAMVGEDDREFLARVRRIRESWETVCGTPTSPRSEGHGRSLD